MAYLLHICSDLVCSAVNIILCGHILANLVSKVLGLRSVINKTVTLMFTQSRSKSQGQGCALDHSFECASQDTTAHAHHSPLS
jgi:hypothetical protein